MLVLAGACSDSSCYDNGNSLPLVRFYVSGQGAATVSGLTLRGIGAPGDSVFVDGEALSETYLPLRATTSNTQWIIAVASPLGTTYTDTLSVDYKSVPYFAGAECGAMYSFELTNVDCTHNAIDSVVVMQNKVTNVSTETMRIYFKP